MARIRTIKPEFWTSEQIAECSPNARLLFIGLWNFCDDYGVHPAKVGSLKMQIFPADAFSKADVQDMVNELIDNGLLVEYEVDNERFWLVTGWDRHQKPDTKTGKWPRPDGKIGRKIRRTFGDNTPNDNRQDGERSPTEKEKEKDINKERDAHTRGAENENEKKGEERDTSPQVAPAPSPNETVYGWAVQNLDFLKSAKERSEFPGKVKDEVLRFCAHYSEYDSFNNQPVVFFKKKFEGWLVTAKANAAKRTTKKPGATKRTAADEVTREKVLDHIRSAHGAFSAEFQERDISALIQASDMSAMRERCAEILKSRLNDNNLSPTRNGAASMAEVMGKIGQA